MGEWWAMEKFRVSRIAPRQPGHDLKSENLAKGRMGGDSLGAIETLKDGEAPNG